MSKRFQFGLVAHFLADYALLYFVIARAQAEGGAKGAVWTFLATSLPAVALFALAPVWDRMQRRPLQSLGSVQSVIVLSTLCLFLTKSLLGTLAIALVLGFTRQVFRLLLSACAKAIPDAALRGRLLERTITIRYACMIPGATLGAVAGGASSKTEIIIIGASAVATTWSLFFLQSDRSLSSATLTHESTSLPQLPSWGLLSEAFGRTELLVFTFTMLAVSSFMAVEYPLLTETYGFKNWMLPVVWGGHLVGSLFASVPRVVAFETSLGRQRSILVLAAIAVVVTFGLFSVFPPRVVPAALLMAAATLFLCRFEIVAGKRLLERVGEQRYALTNLQMRGFELALQIVGPALASLSVTTLTVRGTLGLVCAASLVGILALARPALVRAS